MLRKILNRIIKGKKAFPSRPTSIPVEFDPNLPLGVAVRKFILEDMPPTPQPRFSDAELREIIAETEEPAIGMARMFPPDPAKPTTSFMGGLPKLPEDVPWPVAPETNKPRAFLAQIDCASLPRSQVKPWLPESGTFWIFAGPELDAYFDFFEGVIDTRESHVIYRDIDASSLAERRPPNGPPWWEGPWGETKGYPHFGLLERSKSEEHSPTVRSRWPLEFALIKSYRNDWNHSVSIYDSAETKKPDLSSQSNLPKLKRITFTSGEWRPLAHSYGQLLGEAWIEAFGINEAKTNPWHRSRPWQGRAEGPLTWLSLRRFCVTLRRELQIQLNHEDTTSDMATAINRAIKILLFWLVEADSHPNLGVMAKDRRDAFLKALQSMDDANDQVWNLRQISLAHRLDDSIHASVREQIWHPDCGPDGFDPIAIAYESFWHRPFSRLSAYNDNLDEPQDTFDYFAIPHRLMGAPTTISVNNEPPPEGYVLLIEFCNDTGMDLNIGDRNLIFWIRPQDLAKRDFSQVLVTTGNGYLHLKKFKL
ncbi:DUF1963 domain-containing protein [Pseudovibrio denitrificans]|uniref:DUF1963 domain-containing protein n=1 Tax=Pseudovibrio denitrificans TaxID=258256 RepID=UPI0039BFC71D